MKRFGLIGGLGVGATVHYYEALVKAHEAMGAEPRLLMAHAHAARAVRMAQAGDRAGLAQYLAGFLRQLKEGGAEVAAIPAITPHMCWAELTPLTPLPLVNILEAVREAVRARGLRRVALFGTRTAMESRLFGALDGVAEVVTARPEEVDAVHGTYMELVSGGAGGEQRRERLLRVADALFERDRVDAILLAGTDLALVFHEGNTPFPHVDCAHAHIEAIMAALG